jgi:uncharacterized alkaline shock family protein YloU
MVMANLQKKGRFQMKMKLLDRILLTLYSFVILVLSLGLLGVSLRFIRISDIASSIEDLEYGWPFIVTTLIVSLFFILTSLRFLTAGFIRSKPSSTLLKATDLGMIRVSISTLDTLAQKAVRSFNEVKDVKSIIIPEQNGIITMLKIVIMPDVKMPELTQRIQQHVKEYIEELSGINVREVQVYIDNLLTGQRNRVE